MAMRLLYGAAALLALVALAGCGGDEKAAPSNGKAAPSMPATTVGNPRSAVYPDDPQVIARATTASQKQDLVELWADTGAMRHAAARSEHSSLKGDPAVRRTTSAFIDDLDRSSIDDLSKNRIIDHAAAAVATVCEQCFQQLEAMRPIPAIAH
jgi:ABC-type phosphate/phosphonate transport system substrate-binding protein